MEKTNKVIRIVLSIVTFVAIALALSGVFALPIQTNINDGKVVAVDIFEIVKAFIEECKNLPGMGEAAYQEIAPLFMVLLVIVFTLVFGIIALIKGIILLVKTIRGMSGRGNLNGLLRTLIGFGACIVLYIALLLGVIYKAGESSSSTLGSGSEMMLAGGLISLVVAGVYRVVTKDDRKLANKILGFSSATLAIVGVIVGLAAPLSLSGTTTGIFIVIKSFIVIAANGTPPESSVMIGFILAIVGMIIVLVSLAFAKSLIKNGFLVDKDDEDIDYEKSSIVKSSLWLGFMVIGFLLIIIPLSKNGFEIGIGSIAAMVMGGLSLAVAIVNKALHRKSKASEIEEQKAE